MFVNKIPCLMSVGSVNVKSEVNSIKISYRPSPNINNVAKEIGWFKPNTTVKIFSPM